VLSVLCESGVRLEHVTILYPAATSLSTVQAMKESLPARFQAVSCEVHDPRDRRKLSYLASTAAGRRIYLNRTLVDADQVLALGQFAYHPVLGYAGGLADLFPGYSDDATRAEVQGRLVDAAPSDPARPLWTEAQEVGWLLGIPFLVQVVAGEGDAVCHVLAGAASEVTPIGHQLLNRRWSFTLPEPPDLVVASVSGGAESQHWGNIAAAFARAARVVRPGGKVVVLAEPDNPTGPGLLALRECESLYQGVSHARTEHLPDALAVEQLARASQFASLYLFSSLSASTVEDLYLTPLAKPTEIGKLVDSSGRILIIPDAHRTYAVVQKEKHKP
jgi:nickel-dependent lactate racemase